MNAKKIVELLRNSNMKEVSRNTGIPYDRIAKWVQGKGFPKQIDFKTLVDYFNGTNSNMTKPGIPLVSQKVAAGFGNDHFLVKEEDVLARYVIPDFEDISFMITVKGDSMYPHYSSGDIIACRLIRDPKYLQWNKPYVLATKDQGMLCKRILPSKKKDTIQAISDNKDYPPFDIHQDEITGYALVIGIIRLE